MSYAVAFSSVFLIMISVKTAMISYAGSWAMFGGGMHLAGPKGVRKIIGKVLRR